MLKWFFLAFLVLLYAVLNTMWIVGGDMSTDARIAVFFISQLLPASLLSFWLSAYIRRFENSVLHAQGVAWLILAMGTAVTGAGVHGLLTGSCVFLYEGRSSIRGTLFRSVAALAEQTGTCGILSCVLLAVGIGVLWKGIRLFLEFGR